MLIQLAENMIVNRVNISHGFSKKYSSYACTILKSYMNLNF